MTPQWFDDIPVIGQYDPEDRFEIALSMGEFPPEDLGRSEDGSTKKKFIGKVRSLWKTPKPYEHTSHVFGYLAGGMDAKKSYVPQSALSIQPDSDLRGRKLKITLDQMRIADYPGSGVHEVLFDFYGQNQVDGDKIEHAHFNSKYTGAEGDEVGVLGQPIFTGLNVGPDGIMFRCRTVNVKNHNDELIMKMLDEDVFKSGLELSTKLNPAIGILANTAMNITRLLASRNRNVCVQDFFLGLDFSELATRAKIAQGSYIAVQVSGEEAAKWKWDEWTFNCANGRLCRKGSRKTMIPYNYIVLGVSAIA